MIIRADHLVWARGSDVGLSFPLFAKRTNRRESAGTEGPIRPTGPAAVQFVTGRYRSYSQHFCLFSCLLFQY
eukprot:9282880-Pyramimonas_sp.AAC.3